MLHRQSFVPRRNGYAGKEKLKKPQRKLGERKRKRNAWLS
jgi:hypothetical protein